MDGTTLCAFSSYGGPLNSDIDFKRSWLGRKAVLTTDHLPQFRAGKLCGLVIPVDTLNDIRFVHAEISESAGQLKLTKTGSQMQSAAAAGEFAITLCACYKTVGEDAGIVAFLRQLGVRLFTYSSNRRNLLADGCGERTASGLSYLGVDMTRELERNAILPDVSHLSDASFWDVVEHTTGPIVATHSNARRLCPNPRNLSDDQIKVIAERNGLIGVSTYPTLVAEHGATVENLLQHLDYIVNLVGVEHVAIGTDLIDFMGSLFTASLTRADPGHNLYAVKQDATVVTEGVGSYSEVGNVIDGLAKRGYRDEQLKCIFSANLARVLDANTQNEEK